MTTTPAAAGEPDVDLFRLVSSQALQRLLQNIVGPKTLVLQPSLAGPLGLVTEVGLLKVSTQSPSPPSSLTPHPSVPLAGALQILTSVLRVAAELWRD